MRACVRRPIVGAHCLIAACVVGDSCLTIARISILCSVLSMIMFWSICEKCVPTVTSSRRRKTSKYPQHIVKLGSKCKRLSKCKTTKPSGMLLWRTAQREYMLAIQRFVNNRECTVLLSGDSSAFYRYINQRRACKDGIAPLLNVNGELAVTDHNKADILRP